MRQLALPFLHRESFAADGFILARSNENAVTAIGPGAEAAWPDGRLALWGPRGTGKTHLLHVWLGYLRAAGRDAALLDGAAIRHLPLDASLPDVGGGLAIDDADAALEEPEAFLHLLNRLAESRIASLLAFRDAPSRLDLALPDLSSRLRAILAIGIGAPDDELLDALFARLLAERQLAVPPLVLRYLRDRLPREPAAIREAARRLDLASLEAGRRVTTQLAASLVGRSAPHHEAEELFARDRALT